MAAAINLVTNPSAETAVTGATATNGAVTRDTANFIAGTPSTASFKVTTTAGVGSLAISVAGLTVGQNYTFSFYTKITAVSTNFSVSPSVSGVAPITKPLVSGSTAWQRRYMGFIATATTMTLTITSTTANTSGDVFWVDMMMVNQGGLLPYFDGSYPFSTWTGTAHASTSSNTAFDTTLVGTLTTDEVVIVNGLCLNTLAWNITSKSGRYNPAQVRGEDYTVPGVSGKQFVPNRPIDTATWPLSMFILGSHPDGTVPHSSGQRSMFEHNYNQILRQCLNPQAPVTIQAWHPNGSVRTTKASLVSSPPDVALVMGGRRAELTLAFEILSGMWEDAFPTTVTGTPSAAWSNQSLVLTPLAGGTVAIDDSVITVTGPITNPRITNAVTGTWVQYTGTVLAGQSWVVDCKNWTSMIGATSVLSATTHFGHPRFVLIDTGDLTTTPTLTLTGSATTVATNLSVTATRKHWYA